MRGFVRGWAGVSLTSCGRKTKREKKTTTTREKCPSKQTNAWCYKTARSPRVLKSLAVPRRKASVLSCDLSLPRIIHDYIADMLAHANNFSSEPMSATSYLMYLCRVCMWARHNLYLSVYVHAPEIRFCVQFHSQTNSMVNTIWQRWRDTYITVRWVIHVKWTHGLFACEEVSLCGELLQSEFGNDSESDPDWRIRTVAGKNWQLTGLWRPQTITSVFKEEVKSWANWA